MANTEMSNSQLENLLAAVTDALLVGEDNLDAIIDQYNVPRAEVNSLLWVIRRLHVALVGVQPSPKFVQHLREDLVGTTSYKVVSRMRKLPPRVQVTAALALFIGFMLFQRRRMANDLDSGEVAALPTTSTIQQ